MKQEMKLLFALQQIEGITQLIQNNEYEQYFTSLIVPIHTELRRQLTNLTHSSKLQE